MIFYHHHKIIGSEEKNANVWKVFVEKLLLNLKPKLFILISLSSSAESFKRDFFWNPFNWNVYIFLIIYLDTKQSTFDDWIWIEKKNDNPLGLKVFENNFIELDIFIRLVSSVKVIFDQGKTNNRSGLQNRLKVRNVFEVKKSILLYLRFSFIQQNKKHYITLRLQSYNSP